MPELKLLVTGSGRSGTLYLAQVLRAAGALADHEKAFTPHTSIEVPDSAQSIPTRIEVSWLATPFLAQVECPKVLLYRDPVRVAGSLLGKDFFTLPGNQFTRFANFHLPFSEGAPAYVAGDWWAGWNAMALGQADAVMRVDDLPFSLLAELAGVPTDALVRAAATVDRKTNGGPSFFVDLSDLDFVWDVLSDLERRRIRE